MADKKVSRRDFVENTTRAALAAAFFGVAWLYGRFVKKDPGTGN